MNILSKFQLSSSSGLGLTVSWFSANLSSFSHQRKSYFILWNNTQIYSWSKTNIYFTPPKHVVLTRRRTRKETCIPAQPLSPPVQREHSTCSPHPWSPSPIPWSPSPCSTVVSAPVEATTLFMLFYKKSKIFCKMRPIILMEHAYLKILIDF